jgi:predicted exporter
VVVGRRQLAHDDRAARTDEDAVTALPSDHSAPRGRAIVLALWLAAVLLCVWQITRTNFNADLSAFLPAQPDARQRVLIEQIESGLVARTLLLGIEGGDVASRAIASRELAAAMRAGGRFEQVQNGETSDWASVGQWLFANRYLLSPAINAERFTAAGLRDGIADSVSLLGTPAGQMIKPLLDRDPTGETQRIGEALIPSNAPKSEGGVWVARQGERALMVAITRATGADIDAHAATLAAIDEAFAPQRARGLVLRVSGAPVFAVQSRSSIEAESKKLAIVGTILASCLLLLAFASPRALVVAMLPVITGVLAGIAAVSIGFGSVHGMTLGFGSTLIGEAVDYAIYYLVQARAFAKEGGWRQWQRSGWPTVRLGLLTSVCGFAALVLSGFPGLAQLGVFSLAGLIGAALATRFVLPILMPNGTPGVGVRPLLGRATGAVLRAMPPWRWPLVALGVAAALLLWQRSDLWAADLGSLSPMSKETLALDSSLRADLSAGDARTLVVVQGANLQATLEATESVAHALDGLQERGVIGGYDSVTRWLPSLATQKARQAALPDGEALRSALAQATTDGPLRASRLAPFVADVQTARALPLIELQALHAAGLKTIVDALLVQRADGSVASLLPLQPVQGAPTPADGATVDSNDVHKALAARSDVQVQDIGPELKRLYRHYLEEAQGQALLGALGVVLLMAASLRSWRRLLAVCQPLLLAVLLTMGGLTLAGVQLGILHLVGLLLVVAVGSNYALFFDMLQQQDAAPDSEMLASLLLANLTTVASFGLIALSNIPALAAIGVVVAPGALLALLLSAAFVRVKARP